MCRVGLIVNGTHEMAHQLAEQYANGANHDPSIKSFLNCLLVHCRFDVTSAAVLNSEFPLENERYILHYNGEVYGFDKSHYIATEFTTDVHYSLDLIDQFGIEGFLNQVDFQGTYQIIDKQNNIAYVAVDQLNTAGGFWAKYQNTLLVAQEMAVLNQMLSAASAPPNIPINIIKNGHLLKIDLTTADFEMICYRPYAQQVWSGKDNSKASLLKLAQQLSETLYQACAVRVPRQGLVGVLCSGGVDSGLILLNTVKYLDSVGRIDDLRVFTFDQSGSQSAAEDLKACCLLLDKLGLSQQKYLTIIPEQKEVRAFLYKSYVFADQNRLITPNPVLNTQIRHTVRMSQVLGYVVGCFPEIKCILSGDGADEIFAGYNSMRENVTSGGQLVENIRHKLADFPLNDAARVSLSSYFGTAAVLKYRAKTVTTIVHPMEVRMPFTSHLVLALLTNASADFLVGELNGERVSKFVLRVAGQISRLPNDIVIRKKVAFNEGGGSTANSDADPLESSIAKNLQKTDFDEDELISAMTQLGVSNSDNPQQQMAVGFALKNGLSRLLLGNSFRPIMPDTIYASGETGNEYIPQDVIVI